MQRKSGTPCSSTFSSVVVATPAATETTAVLGIDQLGGLTQHALDVDRLDGDQHHVGAAHELGVVGDVLDAEALGQARGAARAAVGDEDALAERRIGAQPALDHGAGHVAGADRAEDRGRSSRVGWYLRPTSPERSPAGRVSSAHVRTHRDRALRLRGACATRLRGPLRGIIVCHCVECRRYHGTSGAYTAVAREGLAHRRPRGPAALVPGPRRASRRRARLLQPLRLEPVLARAGAADRARSPPARSTERPACASSSTSGTSSAPTGSSRTSLPRLPRA